MRGTLHFSCRVIEASHLASFKRSFSVQLSRVCGPSGRSVKICVRSTCGRHGRPTEKPRWDCRALGVRLFTRRQGVRRVFSGARLSGSLFLRRAPVPRAPWALSHADSSCGRSVPQLACSTDKDRVLQDTTLFEPCGPSASNLLLTEHSFICVQ